MYEWSGGTDYRHTCYECPNCIRQSAGKRTVYKCKAYGITESSATDWKASYIACKHYGKPAPNPPVFFRDKNPIPEGEIEGQMNIMDFIN